MSSASNPTTGRIELNVEDLTPGMVIYQAPGPLIVQEVLTTQTLNRQQKDRHPLIVLSVNAKAQQITVTYIATFAGAPNLVSVPIGDPAKELLVPITPATKEYTHDPIAWENHPSPIPPGWASVRSKTVLTGAKFKIFDKGKNFTAETAALLDSMIKTIV